MKVIFYNADKKRSFDVNFAFGKAGKDGIGIPVGGKSGQALVKNSDNDYDCTWVTLETGGGGGEQKETQSDWSEANPLSAAYIKNKPNIPTKTSDLNNDSDYTTKAYVDGLVGNINAVLDAINGEVI